MLNGACLRSGFCCKQAPCAYGEWNADKTQCAFLEIDYHSESENVTLYKCGKYNEIKRSVGSEFYPAFGAGCSSSLFNAERSRIFRAATEGNDTELIAHIRGS